MSITDESDVITLGKRRFSVQAFNFDQLQIMAPAFLRIQAEAMRDLSVSASRQIIRAALVGTGTGMISEDEFTALRLTLPEMQAAVDVIANVTGLPKVGEPKNPETTS